MPVCHGLSGIPVISGLSVPITLLVHSVTGIIGQSVAAVR